MAPDKADGREKYAVRAVLNEPVSPGGAPSDGKRSPEETSREKAKKWALTYLKRPHSEKEVRDKLRQKGCSDEDIEAVCAQCVDYGFINDREYAGSIVRYYAGGGYGPGRIRSELSRRGIPRELWDGAMTECPDQTGTIDRLLAAKLRGKDVSDRRERDKAANALFRKGYAWEDIRAALARFGQDDDSID